MEQASSEQRSCVASTSADGRRGLAITDAFKQWKFRPYLKDRQPVEVETGIVFGPAPAPKRQADDAAVD
jgi:hypothetical protein